ncbi:MAG: glycosyltransferase family 39 protein [Alphaproteobacteria bacterium]|nr:glycosyltransferase family 39 protein [Alphaproteobacteria bacterium]
MNAQRDWGRATWALLGLLGVVVLATFRDYGISNDEEVQHVYGKLLIDFYRSGGADLSAFSYKNLYLYGGLFDMVAVLLVPLLPFQEYETRHLLSALAGLAGIAATWRIGARLAGERAGFLAAAILSLSGVWWGGMFNHTKDVPFASAVAWTTWAVLRMLPELPRPRLSSGLLFGLFAGLAVGVRFGVVMSLVWLAAPVAIHLWRTGRPAIAARDAGLIVARLVPGLILFLALMALFWPWSVRAPGNIFEAVATFSKFPYPITTIMNGVKYLATEVPRAYLLIYLLIKLPLYYHLGLLLGLAALARRGWAPVSPAVVTVVLAAAVPVAYAVAADAPLYNGIRHFLFVLPPLAALGALGFEHVWRLVEQGGRRRGAILAAALGVTAAGHVGMLIALHPNQYVYYNPLIGGLAGADRRWEMDYWSNSLREASLLLVDKLAAEAPERTAPWGVGVCAGTLQVTTYAPTRLVRDDNWPNVDFFLSSTQVDCDRIIDAPVIVEIRRMGVLLAVVKDLRKR